MQLSAKDIKHIAQLARLTLTDEEVVSYRREISGIVKYVDQLAEVTVGSREATAQLTSSKNTIRHDNPLPWEESEREATINTAPRRKGRLIIAPRVFGDA